jgi:hypothetical protein
MSRYVLSWHEYVPEMQSRRWWLRWLGPKVVQRWRRRIVEFEAESMPTIVSIRLRFPPPTEFWQIEEAKWPTPYVGPTPEFEDGDEGWCGTEETP